MVAPMYEYIFWITVKRDYGKWFEELVNEAKIRHFQ